MKPTLDTAVWRALQATCEHLLRGQGIVWAGVTYDAIDPCWVAIAGPDTRAPTEPGPHQRLRAVTQDRAGDIIVVAATPSQPGNAYVYGTLLPLALTLVVVPDPDDPIAASFAVDALIDALGSFRGTAVPSPSSGASRSGSGSPPPPRQPPPAAPAHAWAWLPIPSRVPRL